MRRRRTESSGTYTITSPGVSTRVETSAPSLGAALSKAQTIGGRLQRELRETEDEEEVTLRIRRLGNADELARVVVQRGLIATATF